MPEIGLIIFTVTACAGFVIGKLSGELFAAALMLVIGSFYGTAAKKSVSEELGQAIAQAIKGEPKG